MSLGTLYTLSDARRLTGENPNLITYLIRDRQIPHRVIGMAKLLDEDGMTQLKDALAEFHGKPDPAVAATATASS